MQGFPKTKPGAFSLILGKLVLGKVFFGANFQNAKRLLFFLLFAKGKRGPCFLLEGVGVRFLRVDDLRRGPLGF